MGKTLTLLLGSLRVLLTKATGTSSVHMCGTYIRLPSRINRITCLLCSVTSTSVNMTAMGRGIGPVRILVAAQSPDWSTHVGSTVPAMATTGMLRSLAIFIRAPSALPLVDCWSNLPSAVMIRSHGVWLMMFLASKYLLATQGLCAEGEQCGADASRCATSGHIAIDIVKKW